jgi:antitoxin component YwqK of YwqJK toxin-antitoxin module
MKLLFTLSLTLISIFSLSQDSIKVFLDKNGYQIYQPSDKIPVYYRYIFNPTDSIRLYKDYYINSTQLYCKGLYNRPHKLFNLDFKTGQHHFYRKDGTLYQINNYIDGYKTGNSTSFYQNGNISEVSYYIKHAKTGIQTLYHENGRIKSTCNYLKNREKGSFKEWYSNGYLKKEGSYNSGKKIGQWKEYHENSKIKRIEFYKNNRRDSNWIWYEDDGRVFAEVEFKDDNVINSKILYSDGNEYKHSGQRIDSELTFRSFPGGNDSLEKFIQKNFKNQKFEIVDEAKANFFISIFFDIAASGKLSNFKINQSNIDKLNKYCIEIAKKMSYWHPDIVTGIPMNGGQSITFYLSRKK